MKSLIFILFIGFFCQSAIAQLSLRDLKTLQRQMSQVARTQDYLAIAEKLTTQPLSEEELVSIIRRADGPILPIANHVMANVALLKTPFNIPSERARVWNNHSLNREELRARVMQIIIALYARLITQNENMSPEIQKKWIEIVGMDLDAAMITIEKGYARPSEKLVTPQYLTSVIGPVINSVLDAFVNSDLYSDPKTKMKIFTEAVKMSISFARMSRIQVVWSFFKENYVDMGQSAASLDPTSFIGLVWRTFWALFSDSKLHYPSERPVFNSQEKVKVYSYPRLTQHVIKRLFDNICKDMLKTDDQNLTEIIKEIELQEST